MADACLYLVVTQLYPGQLFHQRKVDQRFEIAGVESQCVHDVKVLEEVAVFGQYVRRQDAVELQRLKFFGVELAVCGEDALDNCSLNEFLLSLEGGLDVVHAADHDTASTNIRFNHFRI